MRNRFAGFAGGVILCLLMALPARASYVGEYAVGETAVCGFFNTYQPSTGASFTLASEAVDVYKGSSATQDADDSGLTIDDDFDGVTGFHLVCVDTSADGTFYSAGDNFTVVLTAGTVDSVSVAGTAVLSFSLAQSSSFARLGAPAGASVSADIAAIEGQTDDIGAAGAGLTAIDLPNQTMDITGTLTTVSTATAVTTVNGLAAGVVTAAAVANGAIDAATFAGDVDAEVLSYIVDDATRIDASELNGDIDSLTFTVAGYVDANMQGISGDTAAADALELQYDATAGAVPSTGIVDRGTAQAADATTLTIRAAADIGDAAGNTLLITGGSDGVGQSVVIASSSGDVLTIAAWPDTTPTGTITYELWGTAAGSAGDGATAQEVWEYGTRTLTALDEDSTTIDLTASFVGGVTTLDEDTTVIDLNSSFVGGVTVFDEDSTTIDINATTIGTVTTATNVTTVNGLAANVLTAASAASDLTTELQNGLATATAVDALPTNAELATALGTADDATLSAVADLSGNLTMIALLDSAFLNCTVNTANFAGSSTTLACIVTDRDGGAVTLASGDLTGLEVRVTSGAQIYEGRFINSTTWDGGNSELQITLSRALPSTLADAVTAVIR